MLVLTIDQRGSRRRGDRIPGILKLLHGKGSAKRFVRSFERTAGDEIQGLLDNAEIAVDIALELLRTGDWYVGIGVGEVERPIPESVRAATGTAFHNAREAVERAKRNPQRVAVKGLVATAGADAEALVQLLAALVRRRTAAGWEVVELMESGLTQKEVARKVGITPQAVSQRLSSGFWQLERRNRPLLARLLVAAEGPAHLEHPQFLERPRYPANIEHSENPERSEHSEHPEHPEHTGHSEHAERREATG